MEKLTLAWLLLSTGSIFSMESNKVNPLDAKWFYDAGAPYAKANQLYQDKKWKEAEKEYLACVNSGKLSLDDQARVELNLASCQMAQRKQSRFWKGFDKCAKYSNMLPESIQNVKRDDTILVHSDQKIGIGDIFHFFETLNRLKQETGAAVTFSTRDFLKSALQSAADMYNIALIGSEDAQPQTTYQTHLIGLIGHLNMFPKYLQPEKAIFLPEENAIIRVKNQVDPLLDAGNTLAIVYLGEDRQATLIGGKELPHDPQVHGRHLDSKPFGLLLAKYPNLHLIDCGNDKSKLQLEDRKDRVSELIAEKKPFDTHMALARVMSKVKKGLMVGFGADNGPTHVFTRSLDIDAQESFAYIIPEDYDMRMEGEGEKYKQMLSNCWVYKCKTPEDQAVVIEEAFEDLTK